MTDPTPPIAPHGGYLDRLMRRESFQALWPLFAHATKPAKELTESFSALVHLRPHFPSDGPFRVIHVGDGAHARTAALFAVKTRAENISVDPLINHDLVDGWRAEYGIERFAWRKSRIQDVLSALGKLPLMPTFFTFVHAHVHVDDVLSLARWEAAYTLHCCVPGKQTSRRFLEHARGEDLGVLSGDRRYQVVLPVK